jgi:hypothetical protein
MPYTYVIHIQYGYVETHVGYLRVYKKFQFFFTDMAQRCCDTAGYGMDTFGAIVEFSKEKKK